MWSLYNEDKFLGPLKFSNGKTQEDVVKEVLDSVKEGYRIIFIKGVCGTGKSAIALNIAKEIGKTCIVVPGKTLQNQYKEDYEDKKYLMKKNGEKLKISVITGRNNHKCKYLEMANAPIFKEERNLLLNEIFKKRDDNKSKDLSADNPYIPCKIEIKEKNWNKIKEYLKQNKNINPSDFLDIKDVKRVSIATICPFWCPVFPDRFELNGKNFENIKKRNYNGLGGTKFNFYQRAHGCGFYEQFHSYIDADVLVFNSLKYKLESSMNRKPETEAEIIDECDEFLDSFSNQRTINIERLQNSLNQIVVEYEDSGLIIKKIGRIVEEIKSNPRILHSTSSKEIIPLKETEVYDLFKLILENKEFLYDIDDESYLYEVAETARMFDEFFNETYLTFSKKENNLMAEVVTVNLAKRLKEMLDKNKVIIMMSGTIHSENVLRNIFGLDKFKILDAETKQQGNIEVKKTGLERDCKYENFLNGKVSRKDYLLALEKSIEISKKPTLVHINSFYDLPDEKEMKLFNLRNIISREKLMEIQEDKTDENVKRFKRKEIDVLFSTKCTRGIDFPGEQCNSIIFTKFPNPDVKSPFWNILKRTSPNYYWDFYKDKAQRELLQRIYRGLRFKEDHVYLLSPDERVLRAFENNKI
ncbi:MAG: helicase C-terminal domain-containing protein [Candidatus Nanoarchaeia archaeon]|nr:helicase C-terminal domain-containing protein [Candidatus Nanoarchaeia archaeon]MDD5357535.1 helicase C-terminal domain-containing protein [Candidatus Nanoarchaeia archaeon]MDD5588454.1 helicase C-terminal domain-containing protein [Candidatus Nanoarchaeia archaeon]